MLTFNLSAASRQAFLAYASRYARQPVRILLREPLLFSEGLAASDAAAALAYAVFPERERRLLQLLARRACRCAERRAGLAAIACQLIADDLPGSELYQGNGRLRRLSRALTEELAEGFLDFEGFCRFRLPHYQQYLQAMLLKAEDELTAAEEERHYLELLRGSLSAGHGEVQLFFYPGDICQIWQRDREGLRQLEGGHIRGVEWLLLANLISLDPAALILHHSHYADSQLLNQLQQVFGGKLQLAAGTPARLK